MKPARGMAGLFVNPGCTKHFRRGFLLWILGRIVLTVSWFNFPSLNCLELHEDTKGYQLLTLTVRIGVKAGCV